MRSALDAVLQEIKQDTQPLLIMLIGLPAAGKSTFREALLERAGPDFRGVVLNGDSIRHRIARENNTTYHETFTDENHGRVLREIDEGFQAALERKDHIIWDQINLKRSERSQGILQARGYRRIGVYFPLSLEECKQRVLHRQKVEGGIFIPEAVLDDMWQTLQENMPVAEEFDLLIVAENTQQT